MISLKEELAEIDNKKSDAHESFSDVVLLSVCTGAGLGAAWLIKIIVVWAYSWMTLGAKVVGGLIVIPPLIWLAWMWFRLGFVVFWELSQPIRFWFRDSFQSLDGCGSKIGDVLIKGILGVCGLAICVSVIIFAVIDNVAALLPIPIGIIGLALMGFGGADWIQETFDKIDEPTPTQTYLETDGLSSLVRQLRSQYGSQTQIAGDNAVQVQSVGRSHLDMPVFPVGLEDRKELLDVLRRRRDRFGHQIKFWESMQHRKWRDIQIIGLTEMGQAYGMQIALGRVDVELLLEVFRTAQAEYDYMIATLEAEIRDF